MVEVAGEQRHVVGGGLGGSGLCGHGAGHCCHPRGSLHHHGAEKVAGCFIVPGGWTAEVRHATRQQGTHWTEGNQIYNFFCGLEQMEEKKEMNGQSSEMSCS